MDEGRAGQPAQQEMGGSPGEGRLHRAVDIEVGSVGEILRAVGAWDLQDLECRTWPWFFLRAWLSTVERVPGHVPPWRGLAD